MKRYPMILAMGVFALNAQSIPGDPLPGLSAENLQLFQSGHAEFVKEYPVSARRTGEVNSFTIAHQQIAASDAVLEHIPLVLSGT